MDTAMEVKAQRESEIWQKRLAELDPNNKQAVQEMVDAVGKWWHTIDLGNGVVTPGRQSIDYPDHVGLPKDLKGKTVIDVGAWDGMISFEAERRGAERVVAADIYKGQGFQLVHRVRNSNVEFVQVDVRKELPDIGQFDLVCFLGVIYHVPDPVMTFKRIGDLSKDMLILETDSDLNWNPTPMARVVAGHHAWPELTPADALEKPECNWWLPNRACVEVWSQAAGFKRCEIFQGPEKAPDQLPVKAALKRKLPDTQQRLVAHCWKK